ncbi:MAG: DUF167 domain-containing protein [Planctomycetes bacterium]|nr:DUF167 domain-containing protein [Planctomycetota bacterium]MBL7042989.1 DUF167 domain-containing protein [Pirellulaceae bacterium]
MIELEVTDEGVILPVRARPGARSSGIRGVHDGALRVSVTQVAERGKANKALLGVLCKALGLRKSQIELISGPTATRKRFLIRDVSEGQLRQLVEAALRRAV